MKASWILLGGLYGLPGLAVSAQSLGVLVEPGALNQRVCWFQGQQYSVGARLLMADQWFICAAEQPQELNGAVSWQTAEEMALKRQGLSKVQIQLK
ncbi:MAG: YnjH family protein [Aeromonadaceae bacterium]|nr:YnjH family protein [Aeromonadaceae bacterium]